MAIQQLGETRQAMTKALLEKLFAIAEDKSNPDLFWVLVYAKPEGSGSKRIRQTIVITPHKPPQLLATMVFRVDRKRGELILEWSLPGDWPTYNDGLDASEPVPEVISSIRKVGDHNYQYGSRDL